MGKKGDLFEPDIPPMSLEEAVKSAFGIEYQPKKGKDNGQNGSIPAGSTQAAGEQGEQGSRGDDRSGGQNTQGERSADNTGRTGADNRASGRVENGGRSDKAKTERETKTKSKQETEEKTKQETKGEPEGKSQATSKETKSPETPEEKRRQEREKKKQELRDAIKRRLYGQLNVGIDGELIALGVQLTIMKMEDGLVKFRDFSKDLIEDIGDAIRPYVRSIYESTRAFLEDNQSPLAEQMDDYGDVRRIYEDEVKNAPAEEKEKKVARMKEKA